MPTTTTTYSFNKPVVGADEDSWGGYLNGNWDSVDDLLDGTTPITGIDINSGTIDNVVIGGATPAAGTFTTLTANTSITGTLATAAQPNITSVGTLTSLAVSGDVTFGDNDKAVFGAGSDLQIYHSGSGNSVISEAGSGNLLILADELQILNAANTEGKATFNTDGAVNLLYDGSQKLATTSTGVDITGTLTSDGLTSAGNILVSQPSSNSSITINRTDSASQYNLTMGQSGLNPYLTGNDAQTFNINVDPDNTQASSEFRVNVDGNFAFLASSGGDISFYEDTGTTAKFFWDASAERLGIGVTDPDSALEVQSSSSNANSIHVANISANGYGAKFLGGGNTSTQYIVDFRDYNNVSAFKVDGNGNVGIGTSSPSVNLHMKSSGDTQLWLDSSATSVSNRIVSLGQNGGAYKDLRYDAGQHLFRIGTTERMRIDSSGNLLVGTTDALPVQNNDASGIALRADGNAQFSRSGAATARFNRGTSDGEIVSFSKDGTTVGSIGSSGGYTKITSGNGTFGSGLIFNNVAINPVNAAGSVADATVKLGDTTSRFTDLYLSGTTFVGEPSQIGAGETGVTVRGVGQIRVGRAGTGSATLVSFNNDNGEVGTIRTSGSSTSYNTSSDYRLKENVVDLTGAIDRIKQIPVHRFNFIADPDTTVDGFLAHEVQGIVPEAVTGTKDAMRDEEYEVTPAVLDDDGNVVTEAVMGTRSVPDYQGIDQSKLVPLLVATIKELEARITALEAN